MYFRVTIPALQEGKRDEAVSYVKEKVMPEFTGTPGLLTMMAAITGCLLYTSPSPRDATLSRMPSSA